MTRLPRDSRVPAQRPSPPAETVIAYVDGGARGNPGPAGYGVQLMAANGAQIAELRGALGIATNNVAEYHGLIAALAHMIEHGVRDAVIRSDSQLLVRQMQGLYKVRHPGLQPLHAEACRLIGRLQRVTFEHIPRTENAEADRLANQAMDEAEAG